MNKEGRVEGRGEFTKSKLTPLTVGGGDGDLPYCLTWKLHRLHPLKSFKLLPVFPQIFYFHLKCYG